MLADTLRRTIEETIAVHFPDVFIVDLSLRQGKKSVLSIKVDTDSGISLSQCTDVSRKLSRELEESSDLNFPYRLEVSSPGVGFPLKLHRQYVQNVGRHLEIELNEGSTVRGKLLEVTENDLCLELQPSSKKKKKKKDISADAWPPGEHRIAFGDIAESKVIIVF
jgi:ribosome maturation factor RimP